MPKYSAKTKDCHLIVQVKTSKSEQINERELDFFCRKSIRGLLKAKFVKRFLFTGIEYTGPIGIPLSERLYKPVTKYDFFFIMEQIVDVVQKIEKNSLSLNKVVWDINHVYINETTRELLFVYLPLEGAAGEPDIIGFIEKIIYTAKPASDQNTDYITDFTYFIKGMRRFEPEKTEKYIQRIDKNIVNTIKKHGKGQSGFMTDKQKDYYAHYDDDEEATGKLDEEEATGLLNEEEATGLLQDDYATGLLDEEGTGLLSEETSGQYNKHYASLVRESTGETITINKPVFRLGALESSVDYCISGNSTVSRRHANIVVRGGDYYVVDLNSKNKTFINDMPIEPQVETEIKDGDRVSLSNEGFVFYE